MSVKKIIISAVIIIIIIMFYIIHIVAGGSFGIRPTTHSCVGVKVNSNTVLKIFPKGEVKFSIPFNFKYSVSEDYYKNEYNFCLGQDVWMGE